MSNWLTGLTIAKDIVTALAAATAMIVAIIGLRSWKRQLKGKVDYELSRRLLRAVYKVRDTISELRNVGSTGEEIYEALKEAGIPAEKRDFFDQSQTIPALYQARGKKLNDALSDLDVELLEAEVSWGENVLQIFKPFQTCRGKLILNIRRFVQHSHPTKPRSLSPAALEQMDMIVYENDPENDPFTAEINSAVKQIESFLRPHLK